MNAGEYMTMVEAVYEEAGGSEARWGDALTGRLALPMLEAFGRLAPTLIERTIDYLRLHNEVREGLLEDEATRVWGPDGRAYVVAEWALIDARLARRR